MMATSNIPAITTDDISSPQYRIATILATTPLNEVKQVAQDLVNITLHKRFPYTRVLGSQDFFSDSTIIDNCVYSVVTIIQPSVIEQCKTELRNGKNLAL